MIYHTLLDNWIHLLTTDDMGERMYVFMIVCLNVYKILIPSGSVVYYSLNPHNNNVVVVHIF